MMTRHHNALRQMAATRLLREELREDPQLDILRSGYQSLSPAAEVVEIDWRATNVGKRTGEGQVLKPCGR